MLTLESEIRPVFDTRLRGSSGPLQRQEIYFAVNAMQSKM